MGEEFNEEIGLFEFDFKKILKILKKYWVLIFSVIIIMVIGSLMYNFFMITPIYSANIDVLIDDTNKSSNEDQNYNEVLMYQKLVTTYSEFTKKIIVIKDVINELNLGKSVEEVQSMVSTSIKTDTNFLTISISSKSPEEAKLIADQLAKSLKKITLEINGVDNVKLVDESILPKTPSNHKDIKDLGIVFIVGVALSFGIIFLIEFFDNTVKNSDDIERLMDIPVLGEISLASEKNRR